MDIGALFLSPIDKFYPFCHEVVSADRLFPVFKNAPAYRYVLLVFCQIGLLLSVYGSTVYEAAPAVYYDNGWASGGNSGETSLQDDNRIDG